MLNMFNVFEGVRVHGIFSDAPSHYSESSKCFFNIAVYGEKRVKLFQLAFSGLDCACPNDVNAGLLLIHSLPKFGHWVMDVCLLKVRANDLAEILHCIPVKTAKVIYHFWLFIAAHRLLVSIFSMLMSDTGNDDGFTG